MVIPNPTSQVSAVKTSSSAGATAAVARLGREKQKQFLKHFSHLIEQAVRLEVADEHMKQVLALSMSAAEQEFTGRLNRAMSLEQKAALSVELDKASYHIERNANAKILFHALTIKIFHIIKNNIVVSV